jgi:ATP-dependent helicase HrpA
LEESSGCAIPVSEWSSLELPTHLRLRFRIEDSSGSALAEGSDLPALQRELAPRLRRVIAASMDDVAVGGLRQWTFGVLARQMPRLVDGHRVVGYPTLVDEGETVAIAVVESAGAQRELMWRGTRRLLRFQSGISVRALRDRLNETAGLATVSSPYAGVGALLDDVIVATLDTLMARHGALVWDQASFERLAAAVSSQAQAEALSVIDRLAEIFGVTATVDRKLRGSVSAAVLPAHRDMAGHRSALVYPGFVAALGTDRLAELPRYLRGIVHRLDSVGKAPSRDRDRMQRVHRLEATYGSVASRLAGGEQDVALERIGWMIEELRVSLFAQHLGTAVSVSEQKVSQALAEVASSSS